jgi:hypothetical protein
MALAILEQNYDAAEPGRRRFRIDIGSNRYWRVALGSDARRRVQGVELLADPPLVSPLQGPLPEAAMGRTSFALAESLFDREVRYMQLMSFRDGSRAGPAVSPIVETQPGLPDALAPIAFSHASHGMARPHTAPEMRPMRWREAPMAQQMELFTGVIAGLGSLGAAIAPLITTLGPVLKALPAVAGLVGGLSPIVGQLLGGLMPQNPNAQRAQHAGAALGGLRDPQLRADLSALMDHLAAEAAQGGGRIMPEAASLSRPLPRRVVRVTAPKRTMRARQASASRGQTANGQLGNGQVSTAMDFGIASIPALAALLGPLVQQVLTPETVQQVLQMPNQHMQTLFNGMRDAARLGIESHEQDLNFLRDLNPGVDDPSLDRLLASMSIGLSRRDPGRSWMRAPSVGLRLDGVRTVALGGRTTSVYARNVTLSFPLSVTLPRRADGRQPRLAEASLQLQVKDAETLAPLVTREIPLGPVERSGPLPRAAELEPHEASALPDGRDVIFAFTLLWQDARGRTRGAPLHHRGRMAPELVFDRIEPQGAPIPLDDRHRFGDYWHKIWSRRFNAEARRIALEIRYLYALSRGDEDQHHRLQSQASTRPGQGGLARLDARVRSGMEFALPALARLAAALEPGGEALSPAAIAALGDERFADRLNRVARAAVTFRGGKGSAFEIFAYPVVALDTIVLKRPAGVDENGQITDFEDVRVRLALPREIVFRGEARGTGGGESLLFEREARLDETRLVNT